VFLDIPKPTLYGRMQLGDLPCEDHGGLTDRHISIEDTMRVKATKHPGRPQKRDAEHMRNRPVHYELGRIQIWIDDMHYALYPISTLLIN
jgi:hypothetical protein